MFRVKDINSTDIKYTSSSKAIVVDNNDPLKRGRIIVDHPLLGETVWIDYLRTPNSFNVPNIGDVVFIECEAGFPSHPIAWGNVVVGVDGDTDIPKAFQRTDPTNRGFYTPSGHLIEFDDGDITGIGSGVRITTADGTKVELDNQSDKITIAAKFGDTLEVSAANGIQLSTPAGGGTSISLKSGKVDITCAQDLTINSTTGKVEINALGSSLKLDSGKVALGTPAAELLDLLDQAFTALSTQTAAGFGAPTSTVATFAQLKIQLDLIKGSL